MCFAFHKNIGGSYKYMIIALIRETGERPKFLWIRTHYVRYEWRRKTKLVLGICQFPCVSSHGMSSVIFCSLHLSWSIHFNICTLYFVIFANCFGRRFCGDGHVSSGRQGIIVPWKPIEGLKCIVIWDMVFVNQICKQDTIKLCNVTKSSKSQIEPYKIFTYIVICNS